MSAHGPAFYDDDTIFATYLAHRQAPDNPPDALEKPVLLDLVGADEATYERYSRIPLFLFFAARKPEQR